MEPWLCAACNCEYSWHEPVIINGRKMCPVCAVDLENIPHEKSAKKADKPISAWAWCLLFFLLGLAIGKIVWG